MMDLPMKASEPAPVSRGEVAAQLAEYTTICARKVDVMLTLGKAELIARIVLDGLAKMPELVKTFDVDSPPLFDLPQK